MYKTMMLFLYTITALISTNVFASGIAPIEITLEPNKPVIMANINTSSITVQCELHLTPRQHSVLVKVLKGHGLFNGTSIKQGESIVSNLYHLQVIKITASAGAQAQFTNLGTDLIKALCG